VRRTLWREPLFIAGDAAHLVIPTGGLSMNGIGGNRSGIEGDWGIARLGRTSFPWQQFSFWFFVAW
jgi:hypothetical protein